MRRIIALVLVTSTLGCNGDDGSTSSSEAGAQKPPSGDASDRRDSVSALTQHLKSQPSIVTGTVAERIDASTYSYLRLDTSSGEIWAAVPKTEAPVDSVVGIENGSWMYGFESTTLGRRFDKILFGTLTGQAAAAGGGGLPPGRVAIDRQAAQTRLPADHADIKVAKAEGPDGRTIAEIYQQRESLDGTTVAVRGQVVKYTPAVMSRNWLHIRDGSGSAAEQNHDLTVTTESAVKVGDVVLIKGRVAIDRDFGAGYSYVVIIEQAEVSPTLRTSL